MKQLVNKTLTYPLLYGWYVELVRKQFVRMFIRNSNRMIDVELPLWPADESNASIPSLLAGLVSTNYRSALISLFNLRCFSNCEWGPSLVRNIITIFELVDRIQQYKWPFCNSPYSCSYASLQCMFCDSRQKFASVIDCYGLDKIMDWWLKTRLIKRKPKQTNTTGKAMSWCRMFSRKCHHWGWGGKLHQTRHLKDVKPRMNMENPQIIPCCTYT